MTLGELAVLLCFIFPFFTVHGWGDRSVEPQQCARRAR